MFIWTFRYAESLFQIGRPEFLGTDVFGYVYCFTTTTTMWWAPVSVGKECMCVGYIKLSRWSQFLVEEVIIAMYHVHFPRPQKSNWS